MSKWLFPFVSRERYDDKVADLSAQLKKSETERQRLHDLIYKTNFGVQIFDSIAGAPEVPEQAEPELTPAQQLEEEFEQQRQDRSRRLQSIARTRPSQLGVELAREMAKETVRSAVMAHPSQQVFAKARQEASK
jgi:hypothetical protein